jgi:hypothetical protein
MAVKRWFVLGLLMVVMAVLVSACGRGTAYTANWTSVSVAQGTFVTTAGSVSEQAYKKRCLHIKVDYDKGTDFDLYKGKDVYFKGPVYEASLTDSSSSSEIPAGLGYVSLGLGPDVQHGGAGMSIDILWPGRVPGVPDDTTGIPDGRTVEVWGECQGGVSPGDIDRVLVRARYITVH